MPEIETCLFLHMFLFPTLSVLLIWTPDFCPFLCNPSCLIQVGDSQASTGTLAFTIAIGVMAVLSILFVPLLYRGIQQQSLKLVTWYQGLHFILLCIIWLLVVSKEQFANHIERKPASSAIRFLYFVMFFVDMYNFLRYRDKLKSKMNIFLIDKFVGTPMKQWIKAHLAVLWAGSLISMITSATYFFSYRMEYIGFGHVTIPIVAMSAFALIEGIFLYIAWRKGSCIMIKCYFLFALCARLASGVLWFILAYKRNALRKTPGDISSKMFPIIMAVTQSLNFTLLRRYILYFRWKKTLGEGSERCMENQYELSVISRVRDKLKGFLKRERIPVLRVVVDKIPETFLGHGCFGQVYKGSIDKEIVAVKFLTEITTSASNIFALERELKILQSVVDGHEYLVRFLGVTWYIKDSILQDVGVVVEFCPGGRLDSHLKLIRDEENFPGNGVMEMLQKWSLQVALALQYLESKAIIHGDLAARNILLDNMSNAKLSDFGMSMRLYHYQVYAKTNQSILPWRWMAPESLKDLKFSTESDVWSFGVFLWELYTFAETPWAGMEWSLDFVDRIESGELFRKPFSASDDLYEHVLLKCWTISAKDRPRWCEIVSKLKIYDESDII